LISLLLIFVIGSITIFYFAKEEEKCRFVPLFPDVFEPVTIPFQKGVGQKFAQPSGTGIDLGFFELDDLSKPSPGEDVFPLVICAETSLQTPSADETPGDSLLDASPHMQITQGVLEKSNGGGPFLIKVVRQILWIDGVRYELRELYGIGSSSAADFDDNDPGKECVICMTEPKDTAVLPCRHMCMCSECAKALRVQSNKCPICRQSIEELIEIKLYGITNKFLLRKFTPVLHIRSQSKSVYSFCVMCSREKSVIECFLPCPIILYRINFGATHCSHKWYVALFAFVSYHVLRGTV
ncbi:putative E3 ubiquitin-protein ligase LUL4, partial [Mucuna pruriens]